MLHFPTMGGEGREEEERGEGEVMERNLKCWLFESNRHR